MKKDKNILQDKPKTNTDLIIFLFLPRKKKKKRFPFSIANLILIVALTKTEYSAWTSGNDHMEIVRNVEMQYICYY